MCLYMDWLIEYFQQASLGLADEESLLRASSPHDLVMEVDDKILEEGEEEAVLMPPPPPPPSVKEIGTAMGNSEGNGDNVGESSFSSSSTAQGGEGKKKKKKKNKGKGTPQWGMNREVRLVPPGGIPDNRAGTTGAGSSTSALGGVSLGFGTPKRKMDDRSPQVDSLPATRKARLETGPQPVDTYKERLIITRVMISHSTTSDGPLNRAHESDIVDAVEGSMRKTGMDLSLFKVHGTKLEDGRVVVQCCDDFTTKWVKETIPTVLDGKYVAWEISDRPPERLFEQWYTFLVGPRPQTREGLLRDLHECNPTLGVDQWRIVGWHLKKGDAGTAQKDRTNITFGIPKELVPALKEVQYRPRYLMRGHLPEMRPSGNGGRGPSAPVNG